MLRMADIENAIVERVRAGNPGYLRFVGSYGGELSGDWAAAIRALPAVWVTFKSADTPRIMNTAGTRLRMTQQYSVLCAGRSPRSEEATRRGFLDFAGSYAILDDVSRLLHMHDLGLDGVDILRPGPVRSLFSAETQAQGLSVMAQDYSIITDIDLAEEGGSAPAAPLPPVASIGLRYWLRPPHNVHTDPPDAEDLLTLGENDEENNA